MDKKKEVFKKEEYESLHTASEEPVVNLSDFALFLSVMKNKEAHRNILSIITNNAELVLKKVHVEEVVLNKVGKRAIRLDAWAVDENDLYYATEMQNETDKDDMRKRSRFYQGLLDTPILKSGRRTRYRNLPSSIITFITQDDIFGRDRAMYTFTEQCEEIPDLHLDDGTTKIFLNMTSKNGRPELVSLLQYMKNTTLDNPDITCKDDRIINVDRVVKEVKQSEEWEAVRMSILSRGMELGRIEGREEGHLEGRITERADVILELLGEHGEVPCEIREMVRDQKDLAVLKSWSREAAKAESIEAFVKKITA